ncbi:ABC transporter substrate-binding protein [Spirillospora sp. NPDC050679]
MKRSFGLPAFGAATALALTLTGCGEPAPASGGTGGTQAATTIDGTIGSTFSGGKPGAASSSEPITIGLINQEGGQVSNPEVSAAVSAAFAYLNKEQGGIGGRPLKAEVCKVTSTEESAQQCAQRFLNNAEIDVILQGGLNVGANAVHQTINGAKPVVIMMANPGPDTTAKNAFAVNPSVVASLPGVASHARTKGYRSLGIVTASDPGSLAIGQTAQKIFNGQGLSSKVTTFPAGTADLTGTYTSALSGKPDALAPTTVSTSDCLASAKALRSLGTTTPVVASALCLTEQLKGALGDFPQWSYESSVLSLFAPDDGGQLAFYRAVMAKYAGKDAQLGINAPQAFGAAFLLAKALNTVGADKVAPEAVSGALKDYGGGVLLGTPKVAFGSVPGMPTLSGVADRFYTYQGGGKWEVGPWQNLPK